MKIRGRGNSTWSYFPKKPYRIKLDEKSEVLGLKSDKDWIVLANYNDNGDKIYEVENEYGAESLSVLNGTIAVLDGNMIYAYNKSGDLVYSCDAGTGSRALILNSDKTAYVLSINQIRYIDLSKPASEDSA